MRTHSPVTPVTARDERVGGVIAAALNNGAGGAGVAPEAGVVGYRIGFGANGTLAQLLAAFQRLTAADVANNSSPGAVLLVAAPGHGITTTDRAGGEGYASGDYATVSGTSFAAPVVSGIAALMLDANPGHGWRDVQEILAATAVRTGSPANWSFNAADNWNGGAMHVSHDYGFGLVDAHAAVRVAESWRHVSTSGNEWVAEGVQYPPSPIASPDGGSLSSTITLAAGLRIDRVELVLRRFDMTQEERRRSAHRSRRARPRARSPVPRAVARDADGAGRYRERAGDFSGFRPSSE
jgi:subtilisin family serine protease